VAKLVAAFGSSHSPALNSTAEDMAGHARRDEQYLHHLDRDGNRVSFRELAAGNDFSAEIAPGKLRSRIDACSAAIERLAGSIQEARLDVLIVVGDDQKEQYLEDNLPAFLVYCGATITNGVSGLAPGAPEYWKRARSQYYEPDAPREYPAAPALGRYLVGFLVEHDFDVAYAERLSRDRGEGHAFGFVHRRLLRAGPLPVLPLVVNTYYPPNQPRPGRCYALGKALRQALEAWKEDCRVGILASGGLSHFTVDETLDRGVLDAVRRGDGAALGAIPVAKLNGGSSEIRNWIVVAGAAAGLRHDWQEYVPLYRTGAGTGCGMAFMAMSGA
jgi:3-O-methylgallate 3,4-dioxygenase